MSLIQALLIGVFAYLGRNQVPWLFGTTGGFYCVGRPLVAGAIVGLILGERHHRRIVRRGGSGHVSGPDRRGRRNAV